jgi:two-component system alkaline phosphatase synthesis response regulator PhoP
MSQTGENIINEINDINKESFTKNEIINLIKDLTDEKRLPSVESNGILVDTKNYEVLIGNKKIFLPKKVFNLLHYLISNKNKTISREQLLNNIWGSEVVVGGRTVDVHIRKLRTFLPFDYIKTSVGLGYTWIEK